jgi:hypothetical protein
MVFTPQKQALQATTKMRSFQKSREYMFPCTLPFRLAAARLRASRHSLPRENARQAFANKLSFSLAVLLCRLLEHMRALARLQGRVWFLV